MVVPVSSPELIYEIVIDDADGQQLCLESVLSLEFARKRLPTLAALYPGIKLILRHQETRAILEVTDGY